jgi:hypothetical protein
MPQEDSHTDKSTVSTSSLVPNLGEIGKFRAEAFAAVQAELFKEFQEISEHWSARAKSEAELASELVTRLTSAGSVPDTAKVYQEWASRRMKMALEDGQRLFGDSVKVLETAARLFANGSYKRD